MHCSFHGAARTVTGSKHLLTLNSGRQVLLDCGMFQGLGRQTDVLNAHFGFDPRVIDCVILSHAHIDHSGLLPKLVKEGFRGPIYATDATRELAAILLYDSAHIQRSVHDGHAQLYTEEDVEGALAQFKDIPMNTWTDLSDDVAVLLSGAGHIVGSTAVSLAIKENGNTTNILYSGDIGRYRSALMQGPSACPQADFIIMETTYGNVMHELHGNVVDALAKQIEETCVAKSGRLIIPAFSVGRTQELLYALNQLELEKRLPAIPYVVDSPLAHKATNITCRHLSYFNDQLQQVLAIDDNPFDFKGLNYIDDPEQSRMLCESKEPCVIIGASGTADAGRIRHHIKQCVGDAKNTILMAGYCSPQTLAGKLLRGSKKVEIQGESCGVRARIGKLYGMSAHGDQDDLCRFLACQDPAKVQQVFLVHGEYAVQRAFAEKLAVKGFRNVRVPAQHGKVELTKRGRRKRVQKVAA
ncbi:MAG: MBL fold metallo-hydrolase [Chitinophagaceae bacterium]|nr:MBL fold metallo-hydrolase [Chitinophagaceae bacterium]